MLNHLSTFWILAVTSLTTDRKDFYRNYKRWNEARSQIRTPNKSKCRLVKMFWCNPAVYINLFVTLALNVYDLRIEVTLVVTGMWKEDSTGVETDS